MSKQLQIDAIERQKQEAKRSADLGNALARLGKNRDFILLIKEAYFKEEAVRLVHTKGAPDMQTPEYQASIIRKMDSIAELSQFFQTVQFMANIAGKTIAEADELLTELHAEPEAEAE